jgi:hypothetical protein
MKQGKSVYAICIVVVLVVAGASVWWLIKPEAVTFYLQYPDAITVNTTLALDGELIISLFNHSLSSVPAIAGGMTLVIAKGSHTVSVEDYTFGVNGTKAFNVGGRTYVYAFVSGNGINFHITNHPETLERI